MVRHDRKDNVHRITFCVVRLQELDTDKINIGLSSKDYNPPTKEQQEKIEEFAKFVLKDNLKKKEEKK